VHSRYERRKKSTNSLDFDDLLEKTLPDAERTRGGRAFYRRQFQFILVDEYQDTNKIQADFIDLLAAEHQTSWWWVTTRSRSIPGAARTSKTFSSSLGVTRRRRFSRSS
jgi:superfamily I DNA/RNA helicase